MMRGLQRLDAAPAAIARPQLPRATPEGSGRTNRAKAGAARRRSRTARRCGELGDAAGQQEALRRGLGEIMRQLGDGLGDIPDPFGRAERAMRDADRRAAARRRRARRSGRKPRRSTSCSRRARFRPAAPREPRQRLGQPGRRRTATTEGNPPGHGRSRPVRPADVGERHLRSGRRQDPRRKHPAEIAARFSTNCAAAPANARVRPSNSTTSSACCGGFDRQLGFCGCYRCTDESTPAAFDHRRRGRAAGDGAAALPAPPRPRRLRLANPHTGETFDGPYRDDNGPIPSAMAELSVFLRDFHSGEIIAMDVGRPRFPRRGDGRNRANRGDDPVGLPHPRDQRDAGAHHIRRRREQPAYLRPRPRRAFRRASSPRRCRRRARCSAAASAGIPHSGFIHIDTGPVRNWDLDDAGLGNLLFDGRQIHFNDKGELVISTGHGRGAAADGQWRAPADGAPAHGPAAPARPRRVSSPAGAESLSRRRRSPRRRLRHRAPAGTPTTKWLVSPGRSRALWRINDLERQLVLAGVAQHDAQLRYRARNIDLIGDIALDDKPVDIAGRGHIGDTEPIPGRYRRGRPYRKAASPAATAR